MFYQYVTLDASLITWVAHSHKIAGHTNYLLRARVPRAAYHDAFVSEFAELDAVWRRIGVQR